MPLGRRKDRRLIRRQIARDVGRQAAGTVVGGALGAGLGYLAGRRLTRPLQGLRRLGRMGEAVAKWGPAALGGKVGTTAAGTYAAGRSTAESRDLSAKLGLPRSTVPVGRLPLYQLGYPPGWDVRRAYRKSKR